MSRLGFLGTGVRDDRPGWNLLLESVNQESDAQQHEGYAESLTHIQDHFVLESLLRFLDKLDQESHPEADDEKNPDERSPVHLVKFLDIEPDKRYSEDKIAKRLVNLGRVLRLSLSPALENETPRKIRDVTVNL